MRIFPTPGPIHRLRKPGLRRLPGGSGGLYGWCWELIFSIHASLKGVDNSEVAASVLRGEARKPVCDNARPNDRGRYSGNHKSVVTAGRDRQSIWSAIASWETLPDGKAGPCGRTRSANNARRVAGSNPAALLQVHQMGPAMAVCDIETKPATEAMDLQSSFQSPHGVGREVRTGPSSKLPHATGWLVLLFTLAAGHVAQGEPAKRRDTRLETPASHLVALSALESRHNDKAIGPCGEVSRYQILPSIWRRFGKGSDPRVHDHSQHVAAALMRPRIASFLRIRGRQPTPFEWYLLWHCPARVGKPTSADREKATRFSNLLAG